MSQSKKKCLILYQYALVSKEESDESKNQNLYEHPKIKLPGYDQNLLPNELNSKKLCKHAPLSDLLGIQTGNHAKFFFAYRKIRSLDNIVFSKILLKRDRREISL